MAEGATLKTRMTPELWRRLKPLYEAAMELPNEDRAQFAANACGGDEELRAELEALLTQDDSTRGSFDRPFANGGSLFASEKILASGEVLLERFQIVRRIGSGGMGDVYEARDLQLQSGKIALKTIKSSIARHADILTRFQEEVVLARRVAGPNVCRIHELYVPPASSGCPCPAFLTMEYLEGETLAARLSSTGPLAVKDALRLATQLCVALQLIHDAGVVHRDLKPNNVMLVPRNGLEQAVVMDFGLAHALPTNLSTDATDLTVPGTIMGAPAYMAPEQFEGREVSPATDIYALGLVFYELITGQQPFAAPTPWGAAVRRGRRPESPSSIRKGVPPVWDDVIARCLEYDPAKRYRSALEVQRALARHQYELLRLRNGIRLSLGRWGLFSAIAVILLGMAIAGWFWYQASLIYHPPPNVEYVYDKGMEALREGAYLEATNQLTDVVQMDNSFALAHARLAEAWAELDFTGNAEREMLLATAPEQQASLRYLDRKYVDAVRRTLTRDYSAAAQDYEEILRKLPEDQKADGYLDLGRAFEKAGKVKETMASYEEAARLQPNNPAPFVHLGIWKSRQRDPAGAEKAFSEAERLYKDDVEGQAEVAYQRGYAANEAGNSQQALEYLQTSLEKARLLPQEHVQLEVRTLSQLSSVEYNSGNDDLAIEYADKAIQDAEQNGLEYWATDGYMRLGNAYLNKGEYDQAEHYAQKSLQAARALRHPRLIAADEFTLASIRDQQGRRPDEQIAFAKDALKYYRDYGFLEMASAASILVVRGEEAEGDYTKALNTGKEVLALANSTGSDVSIEQAEEVIGVATFALGDYASALAHFQRAKNASNRLHETDYRLDLHCADTLWRLGRYREAEHLLALLDATDKDDEGSIEVKYIRASMELSRDEYLTSHSVSTSALMKYPKMPIEQASSFKALDALAEAHLGYTMKAKESGETSLAWAQGLSNEGLVADSEVALADIYLKLRLPNMSLALARAANVYFTAKGEKENEWFTLFYEAEAEHALGDRSECSKKAKLALDILEDLEGTWMSQDLANYSERPDCKSKISELHHLIGF